MKVKPATALEQASRPKRPELAPLSGADFGAQLADEQSKSPAEESSGSLRPLTPMQMVPGVKGAVKPLQDLTPSVPPLMPLGDTPFDLGRPKTEKSQHEQIQEKARKWLAQTFYGPMLKQMRESPFKSELFSGGRGGQAFSSMFDQRLADRMSRSTDSKLVQSITRKLEARTAYGKQAAEPAKASVPAPAGENSYQNVRIHVTPGLRA